MKIRSLYTLVALSFTSGLTWAAPYRAEVALSYMDLPGDMKVTGILGEWHFASVETAGHPLAEAAFLERSGSLSFMHATTDFDWLDVDVTLLNIDYYIPNTMFYIGGIYQKTSASSSMFNANYSVSDWGVSLGIMPMDGLLITTDYMNEPGYNFNLGAKYVRKLQGETAVNLEASFIKDEKDEYYEEGEDISTLAVDYFFNRNISLGVVIEDAFETEYGLRIQAFPTERLYIGAEYRTAASENMISFVAGFRL